MADTIFGSGNYQWVCPSDRQLALRAKLQTGWSVHTYQTEKQRKSQCLSPAEVEAILQVIQRAERLDVLEQQRVGRLVERLETMRRNVMGNGLSQCLLCGEVLGFLGSSSVFCKDCRKVWKRSGAWFYRGIPKYILPLKTPGQADRPHFRPLPTEPAEQEPRSTESSRVYTWARERVVSSDSDSDSELSSSSLEDRLPPTGVRDRKSDRPWGESGGSVESSKMGPPRPRSHLSGSQSSLAIETGPALRTHSGGPTQAGPKRPQQLLQDVLQPNKGENQDTGTQETEDPTEERGKDSPQDVGSGCVCGLEAKASQPRLEHEGRRDTQGCTNRIRSIPVLERLNMIS
ncbi:rab effector Noc2 isoform X2 [Sagmatias obliquidens]|uniref:rab effector Noc2 isoform X2 n=1 Tax=Sagmatias obliquidens TaxID=3371155 RepID=UPI000F441172|nr:rab effector Noc2 isoform X2 [Lagenorhynchus obliquidens]